MGSSNFIKERWKTIVLTAVVTLVVIVAAVRTEGYLSSNAFCLSCHSMSYPYTELQDSFHWGGGTGINPNCRDCHLPPGFVARVESHVFDGMRGLLGEFKHDLSDLDKFNEHRAEFAHNARMNLKKWDCASCRVCHKNPVPATEEAEREHKRMKTENITCIDCHQNLVHESVPEEDLAAGMKEGRIVLKKPQEEVD